MATRKLLANHIPFTLIYTYALASDLLVLIFYSSHNCLDLFHLVFDQLHTGVTRLCACSEPAL